MPIVVAGLLLYLTRTVVAPFIVGVILAYIFSPAVDILEARTRLPRPLAAVGFYLLFLSLLGLGTWAVGRQLVSQFQEMGTAWPDLVDQAFTRFLGTEGSRVLGTEIEPHALAGQAVDAVSDALGNPAEAFFVAERVVEFVFKTFLSLVVLLYLLLDGRRVGRYFLSFVPPPARPTTQAALEDIHLILGRYVRGQLLLILLMAAVTYPVLAVLFHVPFAFALAVMTGLLEVLPIAGPVVAGSVAALVAFVAEGPGTMLGVIISYTVLRQVEDQLVMPVVLGRAVQLHPLATLFAVVVGGAIGGVLGALIAVPVAAGLKVALDYTLPRNGTLPAS